MQEEIQNLEAFKRGVLAAQRKLKIINREAYEELLEYALREAVDEAEAQIEILQSEIKEAMDGYASI